MNIQMKVFALFSLTFILTAGYSRVPEDVKNAGQSAFLFVDEIIIK